MADNIGSIGTTMSIVDLYKNAEFHASAINGSGYRVYFIYPRNKVPSYLYYFFTTYQSFNGYQSLIYNMSANMPNPGYNTSMDIEFTKQDSALHFNNWHPDDGTIGSMARGNITTVSITMNFTYNTSYTNFIIGLAQMKDPNNGLYTGGSILGNSVIIIPYY